jgi:SAM-dependent methyltransferase
MDTDAHRFRTSVFTGERVIPGQVNDDLWAEHFSRYVFASRMAAGRRALDVGCGTGYGTAELAGTAASATGCDIAAEAIDYARLHYPEARFVRGSGTGLPFATAAFDLITAFEVIEHLREWPALLREAGRVLGPGGLFLVSTPNKLYYTESRGEQGANPYHEHEFEYEEFRAALQEVFGHVAVFLQDRVEAFAFYPAEGRAEFEASEGGGRGAAGDANFFLAICSHEPIAEPGALLHVPKTGNLLRERERHIHLLEDELRKMRGWLAETVDDRGQLLRRHSELEQHLNKQNEWAQELDREWKAALARIAQIQEELEQTQAGYERQIAMLDEENRAKTQWALDTEARLGAELSARGEELMRAVELLDQAEATVVERTQWAQRLDAQLMELGERLAMIRASRWVRVGRAMGVGPRIGGGGDRAE